MLFNEGCWYCIQELLFLGNDDDAREIVKSLKLSKYEMRRCQKKSGFIDDVMNKFINSFK